MCTFTKMHITEAPYITDAYKFLATQLILQKHINMQAKKLAATDFSYHWPCQKCNLTLKSEAAPTTVLDKPVTRATWCFGLNSVAVMMAPSVREAKFRSTCFLKSSLFLSNLKGLP